MNTQEFFRNVSLDANLEWRKKMRAHNQTLQALRPITMKMETPKHDDVTKSKTRKFTHHSNEEYLQLKRQIKDTKAYNFAFIARGKLQLLFMACRKESRRLHGEQCLAEADARDKCWKQSKVLLSRVTLCLCLV